MSIGYRPVPSLGGIIEVWAGDVSRDEHVQHIVGLAADAAWPPERFYLADLTAVGDVEVPDPQIVDLLMEGTHVRDRVEKVSIIRPEWGAEMEKHGREVGAASKAFTDLDEACALLGVPCAVVRATIAEIRIDLASAS